MSPIHNILYNPLCCPCSSEWHLKLQTTLVFPSHNREVLRNNLNVQSGPIGVNVGTLSLLEQRFMSDIVRTVTDRNASQSKRTPGRVAVTKRYGSREIAQIEI